MTVKRRLGWFLLACIGALGCLPLGATPAGADSDGPQQGWWTVANPGTPLPGSATAPDVPANGLLVQGGPSSPDAYAALVFNVPDGVSAGQLTLKLASNALSTSGVTLQVCPLENPVIKVEQGGPMSDAPAYDCSAPATATASGGAYTFDVSTFTSYGSVAVAILPTAPTDRIVFDQPGSDSLSVEPGSSGSAGSSDVTDQLPASATSPSYSSGSAYVTPPAVSVPAPAAEGQGNVVAVPPPPRASFVPVATSTDDPAKAATVIGVLIALAIGTGLWLLARRAATRLVAVAEG